MRRKSAVAKCGGSGLGYGDDDIGVKPASSAAPALACLGEPWHDPP